MEEKKGLVRSLLVNTAAGGLMKALAIQVSKLRAAQKGEGGSGAGQAGWGEAALMVGLFVHSGRAYYYLAQVSPGPLMPIGAASSPFHHLAAPPRTLPTPAPPLPCSAAERRCGKAGG